MVADDTSESKDLWQNLTRWLLWTILVNPIQNLVSLILRRSRAVSVHREMHVTAGSNYRGVVAGARRSGGLIALANLHRPFATKETLDPANQCRPHPASSC